MRSRFTIWLGLVGLLVGVHPAWSFTGDGVDTDVKNGQCVLKTPLSSFLLLAGRAGTANDFTMSTGAASGTITGSTGVNRGITIQSNSTSSPGVVSLDGLTVDIKNSAGTGVPTLRLNNTTANKFTAFTTQTQGANITYTLPAAVPTADGQLLSSTAAGTWSWTQPVTRLWIPAAGCNGTTPSTNWDLFTTTPAVPNCVTGTNTTRGVLDYADTSGGFESQQTIALPVSWSSATLPDVAIYWTTTATSGDVKWTVQFVCADVAATVTDDPAFPTVGNNGFNTVTTAAPAGANNIQTSLITGATVPASCVTATRELLHIRLFRDGNDAADTVGATVRFKGMELSFRHAA